jgi:hypothetical protein
MNDELYKALSKGYADEVEQLNALELIETQQNSIMHRNDLLAELARNVEELQAEVARLKAALERIEKIDGLAHNYISCYDCIESSMIARAALAHGEADQ